MKIFTKNSVYVQKNDIVYLNTYDLPIPASIFTKVFGKNITIINDSNRYEFVRFDNQTEIDFFQKMDWIIDYNELKDLNEKDIVDITQNIITKINNMITEFNSMQKKDKINNMNMLIQCELLKYKVNSLSDFILFKQGKINMKLPTEVEYPIERIKPNEPLIKRLTNKMFNKYKK